MKKTIIALLIVCLLAVGLTGFLSSRGEKAGTLSPAETAEAPEAPAPAETAETSETPAAQEEDATIRVPDYAAMYALHQPDEIIGSVDGQDVTWGEYFYLYFSQAKQIENYFNSMASYYGAAPDWTDQAEEDSGESFADIVEESADSSLRQIRAIESLAEQGGVELTDEQLDAIRAQEEQDILGAVGEGKTAEDFNAYIETIYLPRTLYDRMNRINYLYRQGFIQAYGENG